MAICSIVSHVAVEWLGIKATWGGYKRYGPKDSKPLIVLHGSSPAYDGLDWDQIAKALGSSIESWATAGSSPSEWEVMDRRARDVTRAFVVVTPVDLNEYYLCDFRADIVPLRRTVRDLQECHSDWQFSRRILSQYALAYLRKPFPTVGRSDGVMVGIRAKLETFLGVSSRTREDDATQFHTNGRSENSGKVSDWSEAHRERRLILMRAACQNRHSFNGPKKLALVRLLQRASTRGQTVLVVLPMSPIYNEAFLTPTVMSEFEEALSETLKLCPQVQMIRLDKLPNLNNNEYFSDFVHLNMYGQRIETEAFLRQCPNAYESAKTR